MGPWWEMILKQSIWKVDGTLMRNDLKAKQRQFITRAIHINCLILDIGRCFETSVLSYSQLSRDSLHVMLVVADYSVAMSSVHAFWPAWLLPAPDVPLIQPEN